MTIFNLSTHRGKLGGFAYKIKVSEKMEDRIQFLFSIPGTVESVHRADALKAGQQAIKDIKAIAVSPPA